MRGNYSGKQTRAMQPIMWPGGMEQRAKKSLGGSPVFGQRVGLSRLQDNLLCKRSTSTTACRDAQAATQFRKIPGAGADGILNLFLGHAIADANEHGSHLVPMLLTG